MDSKTRNYKLFVMIAISLVSQIVTLMKTSVVAGAFGTSAEMDAYVLASSIVSFLFGFVSAGISTIIIPEYSKSKDRHSVDTFITAVFGSLAGIILLMIFLRKPIASLVSNREDVFVNLIADLLIVLLLSQYFAAVSNVTIAYFQCKQKYNLPQAINLCVQVIVVLLLISFSSITIYQYALIISAGIILNFILDTSIACKEGWRFKPSIAIDAESKELFKRFLPVVFSTGVYRLSLIVDSVLAASLDEGKITIISYASQISVMINTVIVGTLLTYIYPKIAKKIHNIEYQNEFWNQTHALHWVVCLIIAGFVAVGYEGITLLFQHGMFSPEATKLLFVGAILYIFDQQTNVIRDLIYRYFYACGNTKTPATNSMLISLLNLIISILFVRCIGFFGIIVGTVVSSFISLTIILIRFHKLIGLSEKLSFIVRKYFRNLGIMLLTILVVLLTKNFFGDINHLLAILVYGIETIVVYLVLTYFLHKQVIGTFKNI